MLYLETPAGVGFSYSVDESYYGDVESSIKQFRDSMMNEFEMSDLGLLHYFLGFQVMQIDHGIFICQEKYATDLLNRFNMLNCKSFSTPINPNEKLVLDDGTPRADASKFRSLVGGVMYLTNSRSDIMFPLSLIFRFMYNPSTHHLGVAKRILRYIRATTNFGIWYSPITNFKLVGFTDSYWAGFQDDRKSTSGFIFSLGSGAIAWSSKKQSTTVLSSTEAEYVAASTIVMTKNPIFHSRTKRIEIKHHFIRDLVTEGQIMMKYCSSGDQVVDGFTKALSHAKFFEFRNALGVAEFASRRSDEI